MLLLSGMPLGLILGIWRFKSNERNLRKTVASAADITPLKAAVRSAAAFISRELLFLLALFLSLKLGRDFFAGTVAGTLVVPLAVLVNGFRRVKVFNDF